MKLLFLFTLILSILVASRSPLIPAAWRVGSRRKAVS
jgi:hypothetical protein